MVCVSQLKKWWGLSFRLQHHSSCATAYRGTLLLWNVLCWESMVSRYTITKMYLFESSLYMVDEACRSQDSLVKLIWTWQMWEERLSEVDIAPVSRTWSNDSHASRPSVCSWKILGLDVSSERQLLAWWGEFRVGCTLENSEKSFFIADERVLLMSMLLYFFSWKNLFFFCSIFFNAWNCRKLRPSMQSWVKNILHRQTCLL